MPHLLCNSINLYYEIHGEGNPLLFIHGLGSSTVDWQAQVNHFSKTHKVIVFDLRGHGQSDKPAGKYSVKLFAEDTASLIKALSLPPVHIVGISLGGMIALHLAVYHAEIVNSVVIVNSVSEFPLKTMKDKFERYLRYFIVRVMGMRRMGKMLGQRLFPKPKQAALREAIANRWARNDTKAYLKSTRALFTWSVTDQLPVINCPTLIIGAEFDYFPVSDKELLASRIKNARLEIIKDSRHGTPLDQTEIFNQTVANFLLTLDK
jgi:3-oxoadipate enol-lactonase